MPSRQPHRPATPAGRGGESDYFAAIEIRFQQLRGSPILVSPRDWQRIAAWQDRGIPREVVIRGIEAAFRRKAELARGGTIRSLAYCEPFILELWQRRRSQTVTRREAHRGAPAGWEPETVRRHLLGVHQGLLESIAGLDSRRTGLGDRLREIAERLAREACEAAPDPASGSFGELEERLARMEAEMAAAGAAALTPEENDRIQAEVERDLSAYRSAMSEKTFRETRRVLVEDRIRRYHSLPRLSLFHLP